MVDVSTGDQACGIAVGTGVGDLRNQPMRSVEEPMMVDQTERSNTTSSTGSDGIVLSGSSPVKEVDSAGRRYSDEKLSMISPVSSPQKEVNGNKMMQTFAGVAGNILEWYD